MRFSLAIFLLSFSAPLSAQNMPVNDFLARADALQHKGAMALFSSDISLLKQEVVKSGAAWRESLKAEAAAHKPPSACPPPPPLGLTSADILASFKSIPADQREHMTVKNAFVRMATLLYRCQP